MLRYIAARHYSRFDLAAFAMMGFLLGFGEPLLAIPILIIGPIVSVWLERSYSE
jgi:hypothetical protein